MTKTLTFATLLALSFGHLHCQDLAKTPAFEVASITPCKPGTPAPDPKGEMTGTVQFTYPGGRFNARCTTLKYLLEWAYGIQPAQHSAGPSWIETDRYEMAAKGAENATDDQLKLMTQTLLADRFKLKLHHERKKLPAWVISVGKTAPKLFPAKEGEPHAIRATPQTGSDPQSASFHIVATRFTLTQLTDVFSRPLGLIVLDQTGLKGDFDFTLDLTPDETRPSPIDATILLTAMREQLGLTVKAMDAPVDFLVIESADKVAAGN
jgi:uncharacterized protein (TIGR03435 family)